MKYKEGSLGSQIESAVRRTPDALVVEGHTYGTSLLKIVGRPDLAPRDSRRLAKVGYQTSPTRRKG